MSESILDNSRLDPDILLLRPEIVAKKLEEGGVDKKEVSSIQCDLAKEALSSNSWVSFFPGLRESASDIIKVLISARLANYCEQLKPTIICISDFSKISRNRVSPMVEVLKLSDLVYTRPERREQLVFPTAVADIYIDIISGNLQEEHCNLRKTKDQIKEGKLTKDNFKFLEDLEAAFGLSKSAYETNTMNREVLEELHEKSMKLLVSAKEGKANIEDFEAFLETISQIIQVKEKAKEMGLKPAILEETNETLGRARVFRVK